MLRNTTTTLDQLVKGDRFYKLGDTTKTVHQVIELTKNISNEVTCVTIAPGFDADNVFTHRIKSKPADVQVVFMRNCNVK